MLRPLGAALARGPAARLPAALLPPRPLRRARLEGGAGALAPRVALGAGWAAWRGLARGLSGGGAGGGAGQPRAPVSPSVPGPPVSPSEPGPPGSLGSQDRPARALTRQYSEVPAQVRVAETKWVDTPFQSRVYDAFSLLKFNETELAAAFERLDANKDGVVQRSELTAYVRSALEKDDQEVVFSERELAAFVEEFMRKLKGADAGPLSSWEEDEAEARAPGVAEESITRAEFDRVILDMARTVDSRVWPVAFNMVCAGLSIGVILPVMPLLVKQMNLSTSDFGMVVSAFALSKLLFNIPSAFLADKHGRKPVMAAGLALIACGMGGVAVVGSLEGLMAARFVSGLGASLFTTAASLYLMDIGTPFTRTKTMAPITAGFATGTALGPAVGGLLAHELGLHNTFALVGAAFVALAAGTQLGLSETRRFAPRPKSDSAPGLGQELRAALQQWRPLLQMPSFRALLGMNTIYWVALSGSYMTVLPLMLVDPKMGLTAAEVGGVFAFASGVNVLVTKPAAAFADKHGKRMAMICSTLLVSGAMAAFPVMPAATPALAVMALWSAGGTLFGLAPAARTADIVTPRERSQALALLRTTGDCGLLIGASLTGFLADHSSAQLAMQGNAAVLFASGLGFAAVSRSQWQLETIANATASSSSSSSAAAKPEKPATPSPAPIPTPATTPRAPL
jgi:DHA1 family multidrug resistance protein-like MFS transporter